MKRIFLYFILFGCVTGTIDVKAQTWVPVGSAGFSDGQANSSSIAIDTGGTPYVVYSDLGNGLKTTVMKYTPGGWVNVGSAGFSADQAGNTCIALNAAGIPFVVYAANPSGSSVGTAMTYTGGSWGYVGTTGDFSVSGASYISTTIDGSGALYAVYDDGSYSGKTTVMKYSSGSWDTVGHPGFSAGQADYTSIAIDTGGTPYVAYADYGYGGKVTVMKYTGGSWVNVGSPGFSGGEANYTCIAINGNGVPYVVYQDTGMAATAMTYNGSGWVLAGSVAFSAGQASYISIAIDGSGILYAAYQDGMHSGKATVMKYPTTGGGGWTTAGNAGFSAGESQYTSIAIHGGTPYVVYQDVPNSAKATVMKLDTSIHTGTGISPIPTIMNALTIFPNPAAQFLTITSQDRINSIAITNLLGQTVYAHEYNAQQVQVDIADLPTGIYFVKVNEVEVRKFVKQ